MSTHPNPHLSQSALTAGRTIGEAIAMIVRAVAKRHFRAHFKPKANPAGRPTPKPGLLNSILHLGAAKPAPNATPSSALRSRADAVYEALNAFLLDHAIKPVIDRRFRFDESVEAFKYLESGKHFGKVVITRD